MQGRLDWIRSLNNVTFRQNSNENNFETEDEPTESDKVVFLLAPLISFVLALIAWVVVPFNEGWVISDINIGILYLFAVRLFLTVQRVV